MQRARELRQVELSRGDGCWRATFFAMGSPCEVLTEIPAASVAREAGELVAAEAWRIEDKFSRYLDGNVVDRINAAAGRPVAIDAETHRLLVFAGELTALSDEKFDITSGVLRRAWRFNGGTRVPDRRRVRRLLQHVGWHRISLQEDTIRLPAGMEIDLGGIGKEYAVDRATRLLADASDSSCLVNFGGDLAVTRAPQERPAWQIGVEAPASPGRPANLLSLAAGALATSGDTHRFIRRDGRRYGHILDPRTGWPIEGAPRSVTVAADSCTQAGVLSTLAMLSGSDAETFLSAQEVAHWVVR